MENYKHFDEISADILQKCVLDKKVKKEKIVEQVSLWIDMTLFKIISLLYIHSIQNNKKTITKETWLDVKKVFSFQCDINKKIGGSRLGSSGYLGITNDSYSIDNLGKDLLNVDLSNSENIRPQIGGKMITVQKCQKIIKMVINMILKYFNIRASNEVKISLINLMMREIKCLQNIVNETSYTMTLSKMKLLLKNHNIIQ